MDWAKVIERGSNFLALPRTCVQRFRLNSLTVTMFSLCSRSVIFYQIQLDDTYIDYLIYYSSADVWKNCLVAYDLFFCITYGDQVDGYLMESDDRRARASEIQRFHD